MSLLTERYWKQIAGTLSCYDRRVITGTIPQDLLRQWDDQLFVST